MKLIDILVQELPKHGGWPEGVNEIEQDGCGQLIDMSQDTNYYSDFKLELCDGWEKAVVTREKYEKALSAIQPQWNGEGMPPVGCECEALFDSGSSQWCRAKIIGHDDGRVVGRWIEGPKAYEILDYSSPHGAFRPIRSASEKNREEAITRLQVESQSEHWQAPISASQAINIYDAIAAGKIPHIQLK
ncbi:hypothetical protein [Atlantibacter hermannii]|uniref:hypothetical protein n=1 Tax=Atlantibacter hermannii TaxID=565 RepID=UPI0028A25BB8|nr:hypothetical protein [Atlantibacter hermannii]